MADMERSLLSQGNTQDSNPSPGKQLTTAASPSQQAYVSQEAVKVTVGLITYNQPSYIREAIESIFAQTYPIDELIISDDCSTDDENWKVVQETVAACQARPNKVGRCIVRRNERNLGVIGHINLIYELASNELFVGQAGDDISMPHRVEVLVKEYECAGRPRHFLCHTPVELIHPGEPKIWKPPVIEAGLNLEQIATAFALHIGATAAYSLSLLHDFGPIVRETYEDLTLGFRAALMGGYHYIDEPLLRYRVGGISSPKPENGPDDDRSRKHSRETLLQRASDAFQVGRLDLVEVIWRFYQQIGLAVPSQQTSPNPLEDYHQFLLGHRLAIHEAKAFGTHFETLGYAPRFEIVVVHNGDGETLVRTLDSATNWLYGHFHLTVLSTVDASEPDNDRIARKKIVPGGTESYWPEIAQCFENTEADWVMVLEAGDELVEHGLLYLAERAAREPDSVVLYTDEDTFNAGNELERPCLKPDFSPDYFLAFDYLGDAVAFKRSAIHAIGGLRLTDNNPLRGLQLRLYSSFGANAIGHIPDILLHRHPVRSLNHQLLGDTIEPALHEVLPTARIANGLLSGAACIDYPVDGAPGVLMVAEACADLPTMQRFIEQTWHGRQYANVQLILFAAPDLLPENVIRYLQEIDSAGIEGLAIYPNPPGMERTGRLLAAIDDSSAELLLLARPEIVPANPNWIERLVGHATRPRAGVVAPRLVNGNGRLIGNALLLGMNGFGIALGRGEPFSAPGYFGRLLTTQNPSAVAPEVAMFSRAALDAAGGIDTGLGLMSALIDFALRCKKIGRDNLWLPDITVGCLSDTLDKIASDEQALLLERWLPQMARDPAYNANLSRQTPFALHERPEVSKLCLPWKPLPRLVALNADNAGCGHYRVIEPLKAAQAAGLIEGHLGADYYQLMDMASFEADTLFLQRQLSDHQIAYISSYRRFIDAKIVYELDDMMTNVPVTNLLKAGLHKDIPQRLRKALRLCDRLTVTTEALKEAYRGLIDDIRVVPNYIDRDKWGELVPHRRIGEKPRVGWAGSQSHTGDLALIADLVKATAHEVDWVFLGFCTDEIKPYLKELHSFVPTPHYPAKLASLNLDLAIAPIAENAFNDCKSDLKLLEYGILGYPVIASNFGPYQRSKDFPITLVKNRHKDWLDALRTHIHDLDATARRGDALREHIRQHRILQDHLSEWHRAWFDFSAS